MRTFESRQSGKPLLKSYGSTFHSLSLRTLSRALVRLLGANAGLG